MTRRPRATVLNFAEWQELLRAQYAAHGRPDEQATALPVNFAARDCFADASSENESIRRNAERADSAMERLASIPSDTE